MADMQPIASTLRAIRASLDLTQEQLADRLGVSFASVNRWEGGANMPQRAARAAIAALASEAGIDAAEPAPDDIESAVRVTRRRSRRHRPAVPSTRTMEQMLWDAACSIRGEKDAAKFKDYLLPLLFLKRLSDVFDDEIERLAEEYGDHEIAKEIAESDHELLRFYLPPEARWGVISGREHHEWPLDDQRRSTRPRDIGEHLTTAARAVVRHNPSLSGVIDLVDFASERNGERDVNPAKLVAVVETFSDPRYRLGLADVQPDFLGRAYEYLLRKFAEGSGQSAGEFFTPTEVGFLMAHIMRPKPGEHCHDYACGSAGLLVKLQLVARELDPTSRVPLKLCGQELQAESYAVAHMNAIIHDMEVEIARGDTMINPRFKTAAGQIGTYDIVVANPMWNQPFNPDIFANDPFDRFRTRGGTTTGKGDWAWLQHTLACLNERGRAAVVLDTGAVTRGSGSKNEDKERNIRKWFVDRDLIDGVILLPDNLFYNTSAAGVIVVLSKRKPAARKDRIVLLNASRHVRKGRPKNFIPEEDIRPLAAAFVKGEPVGREVAVITRGQAEKADYNLSPSRWVGQSNSVARRPMEDIVAEMQRLDDEARELDATLATMQSRLLRCEAQKETEIGTMPESWEPKSILALCQIWSGGTPRKSVRKYWGGNIPWVSGKDLKLPALDDTIDHVTSEGVEAGSRLAPAGSVLLLVRGMGLAKDLPVAVINRPMAFNQDIKALVPRQDYSGKFLRSAIYVGKERLLNQIVPSAHGTMTLNLNDVENFKVPYPSDPSEVAEIVTILDAIHHKIDLHRRKRAILNDLFNALLHKLMTGEIRVSDFDLPATAATCVSPPTASA